MKAIRRNVLKTLYLTAGAVPACRSYSDATKFAQNRICQTGSGELSIGGPSWEIR